MIKIKLPATSANLGCGFDTIGIAFELYNEFGFEKSEVFCTFGFPQRYDLKHNLILKAYIETFNKVGKEIIPVKVIQLSQMVPLSRGLGSSATCVVAGVLAANYYLGNVLSKKECLSIATMIEGHPDNVAPCLYGSMVAGFKDEEEVIPTSFQVSSKLHFWALIPDFKVPTKESRKALPKSLPYKDVIYNLSRVIALPYYFKSGDINMISKITKDKMHEPYRYPLIKDGEVIKKALAKDGIVILISGAGPTLLAISDKKIKIDLSSVKTTRKWEVKMLKIDAAGASVEE